MTSFEPGMLIEIGGTFLKSFFTEGRDDYPESSSYFCILAEIKYNCIYILFEQESGKYLTISKTLFGYGLERGLINQA